MGIAFLAEEGRRGESEEGDDVASSSRIKAKKSLTKDSFLPKANLIIVFYPDLPKD